MIHVKTAIKHLQPILLQSVFGVVVSIVLIAISPTSVWMMKPTTMSNVIHPTTWLAINVWMEARGESYRGKLGVAFATMNRLADSNRRWGKTIEDVIWQQFQYSWTNPSDANRMKLDDIDWKDPAFIESHKAASAAYYRLSPDPTNGANHYLNPNAIAKLPDWYAKGKVTAVIDKHEFLKL